MLCIAQINLSQDVRLSVSVYLLFKVQLPTCDSSVITAGGSEITLEGPVLLDAS